MRLLQLDEAGCTDEVTARQQQRTLLACKGVCADGALAETFAERRLHPPELFFQMVTNGVVAAFNQ